MIFAVCVHNALIYVKNNPIFHTFHAKIIAGFKKSPYLCIVKRQKVNRLF